MRIGIDLTKLDRDYVGGVATFADGLTNGLIRSSSASDEIVVFGTSKNEKDLLARFSAPRVSVVKLYEWRGHRYLTGLLSYAGLAFGTFKFPYFYDRLFRSTVSGKIDCLVDFLIVPTTTLGLTSCRAPTILCVHDIQQEFHPEYFSLRERLSRWGRYRLSCWAASAVQASSHFVKNCLLEKFKFLSPEKIFVSAEGVDFSKFRLGADRQPPQMAEAIDPKNFLFYPAQLWPHKNHLLLIEALALFRDRNGYEISCILTGEDCGMGVAIAAEISRKKLSKIRYLGKVPFLELLWLYHHCRAVLALGLHESSSLPLREGAVFGKPLICSDIAPNKELAETLFLMMFSSRDAMNLTKSIELLNSDDDGFRKSKANEEAVKCFNWDRIAKDYICVGQRLVAERGFVR